jgi:hypothetical protein
MAGKLKFRNIFDYDDNSDLEQRESSKSKSKYDGPKSEIASRRAHAHKTSVQSTVLISKHDVNSKQAIQSRKRGAFDVFGVCDDNDDEKIEMVQHMRNECAEQRGTKPAQAQPLTRRSSEGRALNWRSNSESSEFRVPVTRPGQDHLGQSRPVQRAVTDVGCATLLFEFEATLKRSVGQVILSSRRYAFKLFFGILSKIFLACVNRKYHNFRALSPQT